jgi:membrane protein required for colicin V production
MTWVDIAVLAVLGVSAALAFARGLVREVLGIGAWVGAILVTIWAYPFAQPQFRHWLGQPELADPAAIAAVFVITLILLSLVSHWVGALVAMTGLGGLDRTLGLLFGLVRGAVLVVFAYIAAGMVVPIERWPEPVLDSRALSLAYAGADWLVGQLPSQYRPHLYPPPATRPTSAADLLRAVPQGRAIGPAPIRD